MVTVDYVNRTGGFMESIKIGFIGAGNMAHSIFTSCITKEVIPARFIYVSNHNADKLERFSTSGANVTTNNSEVVSACDIIFLTIKPQNYEQILTEISKLTKGKCLVSVAAGISTGTILSLAEEGTYAMRVMPNTPIMIGAGATAIAENTGVPDDLYRFVSNIFYSAGAVAYLPEDKMNAVIAVNGSTPAFFFRMAGAIIDAAEKMGIDGDTAHYLAAKTMEGAALMLTTQGKSAAELTAAVTSKGGTTLAALTAFDEYKFEEMIEEAAKRCVDRANELGK